MPITPARMLHEGGYEYYVLVGLRQQRIFPLQFVLFGFTVVWRCCRCTFFFDCPVTLTRITGAGCYRDPEEKFGLPRHRNPDYLYSICAIEFL